MMVCEEVKPRDCQQDRMSANLSLWLETLGVRFQSETLQLKHHKGVMVCRVPFFLGLELLPGTVGVSFGPQEL